MDGQVGQQVILSTVGRTMGQQATLDNVIRQAGHINMTGTAKDCAIVAIERAIAYLSCNVINCHICSMGVTNTLTVAWIDTAIDWLKHDDNLTSPIALDATLLSQGGRDS